MRRAPATACRWIVRVARHDFTCARCSTTAFASTRPGHRACVWDRRELLVFESECPRRFAAPKEPR